MWVVTVSGNGKWPARLLERDVVAGIWRYRNNRVNIRLK